MTEENKTDAQGQASGGKKTSNHILIRGNLAGDIEFNDMGEGRQAARFRVVSAEPYKDDKSDEWKERAPEFTNVNVTNQAHVKQLQDAVEAGMGKGKQIAVKGAIDHRSYEKRDGSKGYETVVVPTGATGLVTSFEDKDYRKDNKAEIVGFMAEEPNFGQTASGSEFMNMVLLTDRGVKQEDGSWNNVTTRHAMTSYNPKQIAAAKAAAETGELGTGALVEVTGRLQTRVSEKDGVKRYFPEIAMRGGEAGLKIHQASKAFEAAKADEKSASKKGKNKKDDTEIPF